MNLQIETIKVANGGSMEVIRDIEKVKQLMADSERMDKLERLLKSQVFGNGIGFVPYLSIQTGGEVLSVFKLTEAATVLADEILSSQPSLRAAIDAL